MEEMKSGTVEVEQESVWTNGALEAVMKIILNATETQHNHRLFLNSLKRYKTFEEELESKSGRGVQLLMSGSVAENLFAIHWVYKDGKREANNDIDVMLIDCSMVVVEKDPKMGGEDTEINTGKSAQPESSHTCIAEDEREEVAYEASNDKFWHTEKHALLVPSNHPGYVQLSTVDEKEKRTFLTTESFKMFWSEVVNNTALYSLVSGPQLPAGGVIVSGPALNRRDRPGGRNNYPHDYVPCLRCERWTTLAGGWAVDRTRAVDWPSKELILEIISEGCHVVPVFCHDNTESNLSQTEWRLSFSNAEKKLIHSLATEQRQSYIMAKLIMKQVIQEMKDSVSGTTVEKAPSSYHLKTIFLWKCEEKPLEKWRHLLESVVDLLKTLVDHLRLGNIPQYFIPENNLIDHIKKTDLTSVADGITAAVNNLPKALHNVFLVAYSSQLDYDERVCPILRILEGQLKIFCKTGKAEAKLYLCCILNSVIDSLSAATVGTSDESQPLKDHRYLLEIYCSCHGTAKSALEVPSPPVLGAAEEETTVMLLFKYLLDLLQNTHILTTLKSDVFAFLTRVFTQNLVSLSVKEVFTECCEACLVLYQTVCDNLGISCESAISCHEEFGTLNGIDYIFFKHPDMAKQNFCQFAAKRFKKFQENGDLGKVKTLSW